jgi:hypothetical protein
MTNIRKNIMEELRKVKRRRWNANQRRGDGK